MHVYVCKNLCKNMNIPFSNSWDLPQIIYNLKAFFIRADASKHLQLLDIIRIATLSKKVLKNFLKVYD